MGTPEYQPNVFTFNFSYCDVGECTPFCPQWCLPFPPPPPFEILEHDNRSFSPLVIAIIGILASTFLLVSYYTIVAKYCTNWEALRRRLQRSGNDTFGDDDSQAPPNDSWPLVTIGLEESVIRSIPVCHYKKGDGLVECTECSVCLNEFQEDESLRLLPKCNHAFHLPCIDTWLQSHSSCPLCRAYVVSPPVEARITIPPEVPDSRSQSTNDNQDPNLREESRSNSSRPNLSRPNSSDNLNQENETGSSVVMDRKEEAERIENENQMFKVLMSPRIRALSDLAIQHRGDDRIVEFTGELQPMRRSVSLGSSNRFCISISDMVTMQLGLEREEPNVLEQSEAPAESTSHGKSFRRELLVFKGFGKHLGQYQNKSKASGEISKSRILHNLKGPLTMKRSFSGRKFFLSKHGRSRNAIIPL